MKTATKTRLLTAALLLTGTAFAAMAQSTPPANDSKAATPPPPAIQNAPPDKVENDPALKARAEPKGEAKGAAETTGDAVKQPDANDVAPKPGMTAHPIDQTDKKMDLPQPDKK